MRRLYHYVGPDDIRRRAETAPPSTVIASAADLQKWMRDSGQVPDAAGRVAATFVIDADGRLRLADRHSEHVACAGGRPVLSAGEMFFERGRTGWCVAEVSNLSTGYCPEPESWPKVAAALDQASLTHPGGFEPAIVFRRCETCGQRNVVKDGWFACGVCGSELP